MTITAYFTRNTSNGPRTSSIHYTRQYRFKASAMLALRFKLMRNQLIETGGIGEYQRFRNASYYKIG